MSFVVSMADYYHILVYVTRRRRRGNLHLLSGEQHVPPLVDLPNESLCFSHTVVALPLPLQMLHLQKIQLGSEEGPETPRNKEREREREGFRREGNGQSKGGN